MAEAARGGFATWSPADPINGRGRYRLAKSVKGAGGELGSVVGVDDGLAELRSSILERHAERVGGEGSG